MKSWKEFELLTKKIQQELSPDALVNHNETITGADSNTPRQVDVTVRKQIGQFDILIAIECKDHKNPVDVNDVEGFVTKLRDIRAHKGVMVSAEGFTETAMAIAHKYEVEVYRLVDVSHPKWRLNLTFPYFCKIRELKRYQFSLKMLSAGPWSIPTDTKLIELWSDNDERVGTVWSIFRDNWNKQQLDVSEGRHTAVYDHFHIRPRQGYQVKTIVTVEYVPLTKIYFRNVSIVELKGFINERTGELMTQGFTTDFIDIDRIQNEWETLGPESIDDIYPRIESVFVKHYTS